MLLGPVRSCLGVSVLQIVEDSSGHPAKPQQVWSKLDLGCSRRQHECRAQETSIYARATRNRAELRANRGEPALERGSFPSRWQCVPLVAREHLVVSDFDSSATYARRHLVAGRWINGAAETAVRRQPFFVSTPGARDHHLDVGVCDAPRYFLGLDRRRVSRKQHATKPNRRSGRAIGEHSASAKSDRGDLAKRAG